ncbi:MAG: ABC transporter permease [Spirochaetaceae bacterium]|jgi:peptide/nickel transport system permease protein|nr:ABC transporter permease [Spirochaetaceae bacterium]
MKNRLRRRRKKFFLKTAGRFAQNRTAMAGFIIFSVFIFIALFPGVFCSYEDAVRQDAAMRLKGFSGEHLFGTDRMGRDVFARIVYGTRVSLGLSILVVLLSAFTGGILGAISALAGGGTDNLIMRVVDVFTCIPNILLTLAMVTVMGPGLRNLVIAMGIIYTIGFIRVTRSAVLSIVGMDFISVARISGFSTWEIIIRHVLPNAAGIIIVQSAMSVAGAILSIAGLSFLGLGIQPPTPEWGAMLNEGREYMRTVPLLIIMPGLVILLTALSVNLIGDGLRDALDPRHQ